MKKAERIIIVTGLTVLTLLYLKWLIGSDYPVYSSIAALLSAALFALVCLRFVPEWTKFWSRAGELNSLHNSTETKTGEIFLIFLAYDILILVLVYLIRVIQGNSADVGAYLNFWRCTDSQHYLDISRDWYLSEGSMDRLVQLVFLPGYPVLVRAFTLFIRNELYAGLLVSALSFAASGSVFYKLLLLDFEEKDALRCIRYFLLLPGVFFFAAPMSESLFFLLCVACIYLARRKRYFFACLCGCYAAFTRSLGLMLLVPVIMELVHDCVNRRVKLNAGRICALFLIPAGFGAYCYVNYLVSGDPFKFMQYQSEHWGQHLGLFFNTAAYQLKYAAAPSDNDITDALGLWLPNLIASFSALGITAAAAKRLRPSYTAYFIAYYVIAIGATWLLSAPRYLLVMPVIPMGLTVLSRNRFTDAVISTILAAAGLAYMLMFTLRWQVW